MPNEDKHTNQRPFDLILLGATGFTGQLVAKYLLRNAPETLRWAMAGRNMSKLEQIKEELCEYEPHAQNLPLLQANSQEETSLTDLSSQTQVLITTVGPYIEHGENVVKACIATGTDYVDLTGEPNFVDHIRQKHHREAKLNNVRIVNCCGFDSIPHDLGVYYTLQELNTRITDSDEPCRVEGFVRANARMSGGTWHSAVHALADLNLLPKKRKKTSSSNSRRITLSPPRVRYIKQFKRWAVPLPTIDPSVVLESARNMPAPYGASFSYGHYALIKRLPTLLGSLAGIGGVIGLAQLKPTRVLLLKTKKQGKGPSEEQRQQSWFSVDFIAYKGPHKLHTQVSGGDPGYTETAKMLSETALSLLEQKKENERCGVITPVMACAETLLPRLQQAGIKFSIISE